MTQEAWNAYLRVRQAKRAPLSAVAWKAFATRVANAPGWTVQQAVALCAERGWLSVRASWLEKEAPPERDRPGETLFGDARRREIDNIPDEVWDRHAEQAAAELEARRLRDAGQGGKGVA